MAMFGYFTKIASIETPFLAKRLHTSNITSFTGDLTKTGY